MLQLEIYTKILAVRQQMQEILLHKHKPYIVKNVMGLFDYLAFNLVPV